MHLNALETDQLLCFGLTFHMHLRLFVSSSDKLVFLCIYFWTVSMNLQHGVPVNFYSIYLGFVTCRGNIKIVKNAKSGLFFFFF